MNQASKDKLKIIGIAAIIFIGLFSIFVFSPRVVTPQTEITPGISPEITPNLTVETVPSGEIANLTIRGCIKYSSSATIDTRLVNLVNSTEPFELVFEFPDNGSVDKAVTLGPKEKRVMDIPFTGVEGAATVYLYHGTDLIRKTGVYLACTRGGSGSTNTGISGNFRVHNDPPAPTPELNPVVLVSAGLIGVLIISRKYRGN